MVVLGLAGSLRKRSLNRALLDAVAAAAPEGVSLTVFDLRPLPMYDGDLDVDGSVPLSVQALRDAVAHADAVWLATPEYNHSIPAVTKNALDWASRPAFRSPFVDKPVGLLGAAPGIGATLRAQEHLKLVLLGMHAQVHPTPHTVPRAGALCEERDGQLVLVDAEARARLGRWARGFVDWSRDRSGHPRRDPS